MFTFLHIHIIIYPCTHLYISHLSTIKLKLLYVHLNYIIIITTFLHTWLIKYTRLITKRMFHICISLHIKMHIYIFKHSCQPLHIYFYSYTFQFTVSTHLYLDIQIYSIYSCTSAFTHFIFMKFYQSACIYISYIHLHFYISMSLSTEVHICTFIFTSWDSRTVYCAIFFFIILVSCNPL